MPLSHAQLMSAWVAAGGAPAMADTMAAIAQAESGGCQYAKHGPVDDRPVKQCTYNPSNQEDSYGLWQINRDAHPQFSAASLYTVAGNAAAAVAVLGNSTVPAPWSVYVSGAYKQYLTGEPPPSGLLGPTAKGNRVPAPSEAIGGEQQVRAFPRERNPLSAFHHLVLTFAKTMPTQTLRVQRANRAIPRIVSLNRRR